MVNARLPRKKSKNVSYFSHEYIINNHGDLVSVVAMLIVVGLLFKSTTPLAQYFIFMQHHVEQNDTSDQLHNLLYQPGKYDICSAFFYTLMCIIMHALIQEYALDKFSKKLNLTRVRLGRFNDSGQLACFFAASTFWAVYILLTEDFIGGLTSLWEGYPHLFLPFWIKLFYIFQICYWLHNYPELYFQRVKKEEIASRVLYTTMYVVGITGAYIFGLSKLCLVLLVLQYTLDFFWHVGKALHIFGREDFAKFCFCAWNILFFPVRIVYTMLAFLTFSYGLDKSGMVTDGSNAENLDTRTLRICGMLFIFLTQSVLVWNFVTFHRRRYREHSSNKSKNSFINKEKKDKKKVN